MTDPIQTLREAISEWAGDDETDPVFAPEWTALRQVENLVRAAKDAHAILGPRTEQPCSCEGCDCENGMAAAELADALAPFGDTPA